MLLQPLIEELAGYPDCQDVVLKLDGHNGLKPSSVHLVVLRTEIFLDYFQAVFPNGFIILRHFVEPFAMILYNLSFLAICFFVMQSSNNFFY